MAVFFVTGKLGGGKTLVSVGRIRDYLLRGKKVATNLDLNLEHLIDRNNKDCVVYRIPDKPLLQDLEAIGYGTTSKKDEDFGLLVLDELGTWLNSCTYQSDKSRQSVIDWFLHSRHYGWDVLLIVQDPELIDKQVRISLGEHIAICRRTDRIPLPFFGTLLKLLSGYSIKLPRIHVGSVFYGDSSHAIRVDTWVYRGNFLFKAYDTSQVFVSNENRIAQYIPPFYLKKVPRAIINKVFFMKLTKIYFKKFRVPFVFLSGLAANFILIAILVYFFKPQLIQADNSSVPVVSSVVKEDVKDKPVEFVMVKLPFTRKFNSDKVETTVYFNNVSYLLKEFPFEIQFINKSPYALIPVDKLPKESNYVQNEVNL